MSLENTLMTRSGGHCELCKSTDDVAVFAVLPQTVGGPDQSALLCGTCRTQVDNPESMDANHWRCLNDSMWNPEVPVQVLSWRLLNRLSGEGWPADLLDMLFLEDDTLLWAKALGDGLADDQLVIHRDSNGVVLTAGDTVTLIKDLTVKGANFTAKRGTAVRGISLVQDNAEHIEGRVSGQQIVILTQFVKKS